MFTKVDLCLLCLTNYSKLKCISSKDSDGVIIDDKLKYFISKQIKIDPEDSLLYICFPCLDKLNNSYNFKRMCLQNITRLNSFVHKFTNEHCSYIHFTLIDLNSDPTDKFEDDKRPEIEQVNIPDNTEINTAQEENVIKEELDEHEVQLEFVDEIVKEEPEIKFDFVDLKSDLPDNVFLKESEEPTSNNSSRRLDKSINCDVCDKPFYRQSNLVKHKLTHSGAKPHKCNICGRAFSQSSNLVIHKRCHSGDRPFKCDICEKAFSHQSHLVSHKLTHSASRAFKCEICDKGFHQKSNLVTHKRCHTGDRPFKCYICPKEFKHKTHLVTHIQTHSSAKNFKCNECGKSFKRSWSLVTHKRSHNEDKSDS